MITSDVPSEHVCSCVRLVQKPARWHLSRLWLILQADLNCQQKTIRWKQTHYRITAHNLGLAVSVGLKSC